MIRINDHDGVRNISAVVGLPTLKLPIHIYQVDDLLIDTGSATMASQAKGYLSGSGIRRAAITHIHEDHAGMASFLVESMGIPVFLKEEDHEEAGQRLHIPFYRRMVWGNRDAFRAQDMPQFLETENHRFDVLDAPGHHPNHVVFHEKEKGWLFTGDLFVSTRQKVAFKDENISDTIDTIKRMLQLDFDTIFCAHSGIRDRGKERFRQKLQYFEDIQGRARELMQQGMDLRTATKTLFPKKDLWEVLSRGEWSAYRMVATACV